MTVYLVIFLPKLPYILCIYMVLADSKYVDCMHECVKRRDLLPSVKSVNLQGVGASSLHSFLKLSKA
jgi:hypothetical protein